MALPNIHSISSVRTSLREIREQDLLDLQEVNGDPEVTRFLPYETWQSPADASAWFSRMNALVASGNSRQLVIVRNSDARVIGTALLFKYDEDSKRLELGYVIGRSYWGQGYATEALRCLLNYLFGVLGIRRVEAEVNPDNVASNTLLLKLGFTHEGLLRERWTTKGTTYGTNIYGILVDEWAKKVM